MEKLYYQDPYLSRITCTVTDVSRSDKATEIRTDRTIFYPESGGQPGDRGKLGQYNVLDTRKDDDGDSVLILEPEAKINKGDVLELVLDWDHRYKFMVIHAAQHMLSGLLFTMFGIGTVAVHQGDEYLTIETDKSAIDGSIIDELVLAANERIRENHEIIYHEMSHKDAEALGLRRSIKVEGDVRIVEIKDVDRIACGGIHVARTGEIGIIYCLGHEQIRGHVRLYFSCGRQALESLIADSKVVRDLNRTFSCRTDEITSKVAETLASLSEAKAEAGVAMRRLALT
ncbi:MAG: alanyl-tRNA editing protein, partial [Spirochaetales bacterium]|nr:alanyl-tRNA editing protein [Spirochaetales bacterium]